MSTTAAPAPPAGLFLSAEAFAAMPDDGRHTELIRGRVVEMPPPKPAHGYHCANIVMAVGGYVRSRDLGRVVGNDSGVVTERGPDTVRGMDAAFYSYARVPKGPLPAGYWPPPELVFEVLSPSDRWPAVAAKVSEYLNAGVLTVCVLDPDARALYVYPATGGPRVLAEGDDLALPEVFPDFRAPVRQLLD